MDYLILRFLLFIFQTINYEYDCGKESYNDFEFC